MVSLNFNNEVFQLGNEISTIFFFTKLLQKRSPIQSIVKACIFLSIFRNARRGTHNVYQQPKKKNFKLLFNSRTKLCCTVRGHAVAAYTRTTVQSRTIYCNDICNASVYMSVQQHEVKSNERTQHSRTTRLVATQAFDLGVLS